MKSPGWPLSSRTGSRQARGSRTREGLVTGHLWKELPELLCRVWKKKGWLLLEDWKLKHQGGLGAKGLGLGDDGASGLGVLPTKAGMQQRLGRPEWLTGLG